MSSSGQRQDPGEAASESDVISQVSGHLSGKHHLCRQPDRNSTGASCSSILAGGGQGKHLRMRRERDTKLLHRQERHAVSAASSNAGGLRRPYTIAMGRARTRMSGPPRRPALRAKRAVRRMREAAAKLTIVTRDVFSLRGIARESRHARTGGAVPRAFALDLDTTVPRTTSSFSIARKPARRRITQDFIRTLLASVSINDMARPRMILIESIMNRRETPRMSSTGDRCAARPHRC